MEVYFLASGARVALFDPEDFEGKTGKEVKQALAAEIGASRFRQRLFLEDGAYEIPDDEILGLAVVKVALVLLDFCPPDLEDDEQIMLAARNNDALALEVLLKQPRSPNVLDSGETALRHTARQGHVEVLRLLLEAGAQIDASKGAELTALHDAAQNGHLDAVRLLVEVGAEIDQPGVFGSTPLHLAVARGHLDIVRFLVEVGAHKDQRTTRGSTALLIAAHGGHLEIVRVLVEAGADKDRTDHLGKTALHMAAFQGHFDIVRFLVESGANRCLKTKCGSTAWDLAYERCQIQVLLFLAPFERLEAEPSPDNKNKARKVGNSSSKYRT